MFQNNLKKINKRNLLTGLFLTGLLLLGSHSPQLNFLPSQINNIIGQQYIQLILFLPILVWVPESLWHNTYLDLSKRQFPRDGLFVIAVLIGFLVSLIALLWPELLNQFGLETRIYFGTLASLLIIKEITDFGINSWFKRIDYERNVSFYEKNLFTQIQRFSLIGLVLSSLIALGWIYLTEAPFYLIISLFMTVLVVMSPKYLLLACSGLMSQVVRLLDEKKVKLANPENLINLSQLGRVIFFKTGILTLGQVKVTDMMATKPKVLLKLAGSLEQGLMDPIALALREKLGLEKLQLDQVSQQKVYPGLGVTGLINGRKVALGNMALMKQENIVVGVLQREKSRLEKLGKKVLVLGFVSAGKTTPTQPGEVVGLIGLEDKMRPEAKPLIKYLGSQGVESWIVTAESRVSAEVFGQELGLSPDNILSEILPSQQDLIINELKKRNQPEKSLLLVHLANSKEEYKHILDVTLTSVEGPESTVSASNVVISNKQLGKIEDLIRESLATNQRLSFNLITSFIYLGIFVPVSLGLFLFAPLNLALNPILAVTLSSLLGAGLVANSSLSNKG